VRLQLFNEARRQASADRLRRLSGHLVSLGVDEILDYFAGPLSLRKGANRSIGIGKNVVVLCSLEISFIVCR
jgi:hypothetical protein